MFQNSNTNISSKIDQLEDGSLLKINLEILICLMNQLEYLRKVAHLSKINLETPLFPKDGIEEKNGLIMLPKEYTVQENKERNFKKITSNKNNKESNEQLDDELKIIKELEEIIYEIDHKKLNLNYQLSIIQESIIEL
ncbi:36225_t:CDS:2 [Racocetra persica]|uniref:36225_t:CDS:1 n=1 Tax=Racocetra persica TaxID=160502 RepID=A0ACA9RR55_9GLOM|nr:36225_t:CDS:2 [Racocetra persica]